MTPEGKVKVWARAKYDVVFPGHWRISPRGGPFGKAGTGDDILCWGGVFIMIEIKSMEGSVSALQLNQLRAVQRAHGVAAVLRGKDLTKLYAIQRVALSRMKPEAMKSVFADQPHEMRIVIDESSSFQGQ